MEYGEVVDNYYIIEELRGLSLWNFYEFMNQFDVFRGYQIDKTPSADKKKGLISFGKGRT